MAREFFAKNKRGQVENVEQKTPEGENSQVNVEKQQDEQRPVDNEAQPNDKQP